MPKSTTNKTRSAASTSEDYAWREYGVTSGDLKRFAQRMDLKIAKEFKEGTVKRFSGDLKRDLLD